MKPFFQYLVLFVLGVGIIAMLGLTISGPVIYSLEMNLYPSLFHENIDALKIAALNSTTDVLPLMQDLLDYDGPIVLNINLRDMDQIQYYLDLYAKNNIKFKNLVVNLDMSESELQEFSTSKLLQQKLLQELSNSTVTIDELDSLMVTYHNDKGMLMSLQLQRAAILKKIHEISAEYQIESEKTQNIASKMGLDTTQEKESVQEVRQLVNTLDNKNPVTENPLPRIPTLSLLVQPDVGKYGDRIGFSGIYLASSTKKNEYPVTIYTDSLAVVSASTDLDGVYTTSFEIEHIMPGVHAVYATSGLTSSAFRTFSVIPVNSTTLLDIQAVYNKPVILCTGDVFANRQVKDAPVDIISDYRDILRQNTDKNGVYSAQIRLSPGIHDIQARFDNTTYPVYSSRSLTYEVEAGPDSILGIRLLNATMSADEISLTLDPVTASYKDTVTIAGFLSGTNPKNKSVDLFIDGVYSRSLQTGPDGSYSGQYGVEKIRAGTHTLFTHYLEPAAGEIYSESRQLVVNATDTITTLDIGVTDGGTGVICTGNVTAGARAVTSAPAELVWDDQNIITVQTDATGSFRQKISLPVGNHSIFARFTSPEYPLRPSRSKTQTVAVLPSSPGLSLTISPSAGIYKDTLTFEGILIRPDNLAGDVDIFINNNYVSTVKSDSKGRYFTHMIIEHLPAGQHQAIARSGNISSDNVTFQVSPVVSQTSLMVTSVNNSALYDCTGRVMAFDHAGDLVRKLSTLKDARMILSEFWENPLDHANRPVRFAPVAIISNNATLLQTTTDADGYFSRRIAFPEGDNQVVAEFVNDSYPLFDSSSETTEVNIPSANVSVTDGTGQNPLRILEPLALAVILLIFIGGAVFYLKQKSVLFSQKGDSPDTTAHPDIPLTGEHATGSGSGKEARQSMDSFAYDRLSGDPIFVCYLRVLEKEGLSTAARAVYVHFTGNIAQNLHIRNHRVLTPREFLRSCKEKPFTGIFSSFIFLYEQVRYGGVKTQKTKTEFEESVQKTDKSLEGEDH